ncbi:ribonuclease H-like domain-containing protein [Lysobacter sp. SG-8]|uniref:Ribonuclease H-like domain-containing protein n=1 Tax=Marilutibacter penaei TaxID=2759900 RepID=A0A7W3U658_9GAMM|nr:ribonuclease H-like domain-containing protein [Lysobacter penaei]
MNATLERLRVLQRQSGASALVAPARVHTDVAPPPLDPAPVLRRLLPLRQRTPPVRPAPVDRELPGEEIAEGLRLVTTSVPFPPPSSPVPLAFAGRNDAITPARLLFFDTETTGLAGGTGTRAFQIGAADWHAGHLRVRQLLMTSMAAEPAMLREFARWLEPRTVLCSYNGRCYDAPLLKTRYRLARMVEPLGKLDHLDLLFPTRRFHKGRWENCRLGTIERRLLGIVREDDLPGSQAPAAWLSYLRGGAAADLRRVCAHNHQDVVTLARLLLSLASSADDNAVALPGLHAAETPEV